jgi:hypothetical protein
METATVRRDDGKNMAGVTVADCGDSGGGFELEKRAMDNGAIYV